MAILKVLSLNIGNATALAGLLAVLRLEKPQIIMLQEVTLSSDQLSTKVAKFGYKAETNIDVTNPTALGTGFLWQSQLQVSDVYSVVECRGQALKIGQYTFINLYVPSGSQNRQARRDFFGQDIFTLVRSFDQFSYPVLGGDFNCVLSAKDTERNFSSKQCPALKDLVETFNYLDAYRVLHPEGNDFSFHRPSCAASRLDRFYIPQNLMQHVKSVTYQASLGDHHCVGMILNLPDIDFPDDTPSTSSPYLKLNSSILEDEDFLENFSNMYSKLRGKISDYPDIADWWDLLAKPSIRKFCMGVSSKLAIIRRDTKKYLFAYLNIVLKQGDWAEVARIRQQLKAILLQESMGFVVRSRYKENLETEMASLFHANRENKNYSKNNHHELKIGDKISSDKTEIESEILGYYNALFNGHHNRDYVDTGHPFIPDNSQLPDFLTGLGKLSPSSKVNLAKDLTFEEVEFIVLHDCERNKSPGLDGLSYEFYKATWSIIGKDFTEVLQVEMLRFLIIESDRHGATRLTPKVDGVPSVTELRPITLLNCDYKILSKCFVKRLIPVMPEVIKSGQLCSNGVKNILFGIFNVISSIEYVNLHKVAAYFVSYDMYKAYDRVMLRYLVKVMEVMDFPEQFVKWILMMHEGATTRFILDILTDPISVLFSIRQGDPLSMLLYIIYIEPLLMMIKRMTKGLAVSSVKQQDEDYCDDINFVGENIADLLVIEEIFCNFENCSGAILSRSFKSKIMGLGVWKGRQDWPLKWLKVESSIKMFGFQVAPIYKQTLTLCWDSCLTAFRKTIMSWKTRQLNTLVEKVEVLRIFATSKIWYKASALPLPPSFAKKFESLMGSFLWVGKLERLQLDEVKNDRSLGGLGLPCVSSKANSLFLKQTCRLLVPSSKQYKHVKYWIGLHLRDYFPEMAHGPHAEIVCQYLQHLRLLLVEGFVLGDLKIETISRVTAMEHYLGYTSTFPPPKIIFKCDVDWSLTWERMNSSLLDPGGREYLFLIVNNIVPNRERLFDEP